MKEFATHILLFMGFFGIFDKMIVKEKFRDDIALYIFGAERINFPRMENSLIGGLIGFVLPKSIGRAALRLWGISITLILIVFVADLFHDNSVIRRAAEKYENWEFFSYLMYLALALIVVSLLSLPSDYLSALITKKIFYGKSRSILTYPLWILFDLLLSAVLIFLFLRMVGFFAVRFEAADLTFDPTSPSEALNSLGGIISIWWFGITISTVSVIILSIAQIVALTLGSLLRFASTILRANRWLAANSEFLCYPFTFMGMILGLITYFLL